MPKPKANVITIKELHARTGALVRKVGEGKTAVIITDRGQAVAVIAPCELLPRKAQRRLIIPGYEEMMAAKPGPDSILASLDEIRADRL